MCSYSIPGSVTSMLEQPSSKITTDSDFECSYIAYLADFNVIRVIIIVITVIRGIIVIRVTYSNNSGKIIIVIIVTK